MARKRLHGDGAVGQRADGRWWYRIRVGPAKQRKAIYAKSRAELFAKIADEKAKNGGEFKGRPRATVAKYLESWLEHDVKPNRAKSTYVVYRAQIHHVVSIIGDVRLLDVDAALIKSLYQRLRDRALGKCTLKKVHTTMTTAWNAAVKEDLVPRNPFDRVEAPRYHEPEMRFLDADECRRLLETARPTRYFALVALLLATGARFGEVSALTWRDVDWEHRRIVLQRGHSEASGKVEAQRTKTATSKRGIDVDRATMSLLAEHRKAMLREGHGSGLVFVGPDGGALRRGNFRKRYWMRLVLAASLEGLRPHELRHTHATMLLTAGIHPKVVAERLGHATVKITLDRYSHVVPAIHREAAERIEGLLYGRETPAARLPFDTQSLAHRDVR